MALKGQVEQEKVACSNLRRELQIEQSRSELLEKRLDDTQKELEEERHNAALKLQEKTHTLVETETRLTEIHSKLTHANRLLDEERGRSSRQVDELSRRHQADEARDRKFIFDLRSQLEQERRQGEELAAATDKLRAELLQSRRRWEEEERKRKEEQEAAARHRVAIEALREQQQEAARGLEKEREQSRRQGAELSELKERLRVLKDKERGREEQWERERSKERQERMERERRQEKTNNKLVCTLSSQPSHT